MILADVRRQLTRRDAQLAARLIACESSAELQHLEARLADEGIDALLDDPRLPAALLEQRRGSLASLPLFMYVVVRHSLRRVGEEDRLLADYVTSVLLHFALRGRAERVAESDDEVYTTLFELYEEVNDPDARRSFLVRTHLGNYALWLSGLFPDRIEHVRWRRGGPDLQYYEELGRRGFQLAADHRLAEQHGLATLYATAAERFGLLRIALNGVSDALLFPAVHTPERLMRQVQDEASWRLLQ
ncbi:MAG: hypothetical protein ABR499_09430 [Gemmatimonadaceae bacterium]